MKVFFVCGYWSKLTDHILGRPTQEYRYAYLYVWAVKYGTYKRDFNVTNGDGTITRINKANFATARRRFGRFVEQRVNEQGWANNPLIVAVPSRDAIVGAASSRSSSMLSECMAHTAFTEFLSDGLRWNERMIEAHKGGERGREQSAAHLVFDGDVEGRNVVLIDDLLTRGGTLLAAKDALEAAGANVLGAVTVGRTMYEREIKAFGRQEFGLVDELDDYGKAVAQYG